MKNMGDFLEDSSSHTKILSATGSFDLTYKAALFTQSKVVAKSPGKKWKRKIVLAEHSPIRLINFVWKWEKIPYFVVMHLRTHKIGVEFFVQSQRGIEKREELPQGNLINVICSGNLQAIINISRKRLCRKADINTQLYVRELKELIESSLDMYNILVPECVYRGFCPEMKSCGYSETDDYLKEVKKYRGDSKC